MKRILFVGPPGVGKGTQAFKLVEELKIPHISSGDMFREAISNKTELGKSAKSFIDKGELVPDDVTIGIVKERLLQNDCKKGFLLDGFPRTIEQAKALDKILNKEELNLEKVIELKASDEILIERLIGRRICKNCGASFHLEFNKPKRENVCDNCEGELYQRKDDNMESAKTRLNVYKKQTMPIIEYYNKKGIHSVIEGVGITEEIYNKIKAELE